MSIGECISTLISFSENCIVKEHRTDDNISLDEFGVSQKPDVKKISEQVNN